MNLNEFLNTDIKIPSSVDTDLQLVNVILIYKTCNKGHSGGGKRHFLYLSFASLVFRV